MIDEQYEKAIDNAKLALDNLSQTSSVETKQKMDLLLVLVRAHQELKRFEAAFDYLGQLRSLERNFSSHVHGEEMINIKLDLEAKLAQKELTLLEAKNALQASELRISTLSRDILLLCGRCQLVFGSSVTFVK